MCCGGAGMPPGGDGGGGWLAEPLSAVGWHRWMGSVGRVEHKMRLCQIWKRPSIIPMGQFPTMEKHGFWQS